MKIKFTAECEVLDGVVDSSNVKDRINKELSLALCCLEQRFPSESTMSHLTVELAEIIPDTDPRCPKCNSKNIVITMAASKDNMEYHCYACGYDFHCRELKK